MVADERHLVNDRTHGLQLKAAFLKASPVRAFGAAVFELIEQKPARLREETGIGPKRAAHIIAVWADQKVIRGDHAILHANGVGTSRGNAEHCPLRSRSDRLALLFNEFVDELAISRFRSPKQVLH